MRLFVVVDLLGAGRLVGVFATEAQAREVVGSWPHYHKVVETEAHGFLFKRRRMRVHVLVNQMGGGGVVGVYALKPKEGAYLKVWKGRLGEISEAALGWAIDGGQRAHLSRLMGRK